MSAPIRARAGRLARVLLAAVLVLDAAASGAALLVARRTWQTIRTATPARVDVLQVSGRTVDAASTALALVALAGVVAVLATRGTVRRVVGAVVALAGVGLVWRAFASSDPVGTSRARSLVTSRHRTVDTSAVVPAVTTHGVWPVLSGVCGVCVLAAGAIIAWRGHRWQVLSSRYERVPRPADEPDAARAATTWWTALDRGEDPTH